MKGKIQNIVDDQINKLTKCIEALKDLEIKTIDIDSTYLRENYRKAKTFSKCVKFKDIYNSLPKKNPVLYWFTFDTEKLNDEMLLQIFSEIREKTKGRKLSELSKTLRLSKGTLYVGKVKKDFHYRFVNHLGHSVNNDTASLQLTYWYDALKYGSLKLNYIVLEEDMKTLISVLEIELAKELKPIIGSHNN